MPRKFDSKAAVRMYESGMSQRQIAAEFGVSQSAVSKRLADEGCDIRPRTKVPPTATAEIIEKYRAGWSLNQLAGYFGVSAWAISNHLKENGEPVRRRGATKRVVSEELADQIVDLYESGLSQEMVAAELGGVIGQAQVGRVLRRRGVRQRSGGGARGAVHHAWKGGRVKSAGGYFRIWADADDPILGPMTPTSGYVLEHRAVMARALGRPLLDSETVHHINGDRADNRLTNLQLRQGKHGAGVRFVCADCGSHNVIAAPLPGVANMAATIRARRRQKDDDA